jgi:glycerophosphoryl diester phosphodiesterase
MILTNLAARPVIAHRGESGHAPENTIESFRRAVAAGADAIEFDLRLTRDGKVVVLHDPTVDRTTDGRGTLGSRTLAEVRELDAGYRFTRDRGRTHPFRGQVIRIPTFEEVISSFPETPFLIELKEVQVAAAVRELIERRGISAKVLVDSAKPEALQPFAGTAIATGASSEGAFALLRRSWSTPSGARHLFRALCIPYRYYGVAVPIRRMAAAAAAGGAVTHVWTVNDPALAERFWRDGAQGIITNYPRTMLDLRERIFPRARR